MDEAQEPEDHEGSNSERSLGDGSDSDDQVDGPDPHDINLVQVRQDL